MTYRAAAYAHDLVFTVFNNAVSAIDLHSGAVRWKIANDDIMKVARVFAADSYVFVLFGGELLCVEPADGTCRWRRTLSLEPGVQAMKISCVGDGVLAHYSNQVTCVDLATGSVRWHHRANAVATFGG